jgi:hypothetical protein
MDLKLQHALAVALPAKHRGVLPSTDIFSEKMTKALSGGVENYIESIDPKNSTLKGVSIVGTNKNRSSFLQKPRAFKELEALPKDKRSLRNAYTVLAADAGHKSVSFSPFSQGKTNPAEELYLSMEQRAAREDISEFKKVHLPKALLPTFRPKQALDPDMFDSLVHAGRELYRKRTGEDLSSKAFSNRRFISALKGGLKGSAIFGVLGGGAALAGVLKKRKEVDSLGAKNGRR